MNLFLAVVLIWVQSLQYLLGLYLSKEMSACELVLFVLSPTRLAIVTGT
jgi:hypothetical protein